MMRYLIVLILPIILLSCKKKELEVTIPYSRVSLYTEAFEDDQTWISLPENSYYTPGSECVKLEDNLLKLTFDQQLQNCGCAWVGARKSVTHLENIPKDKLGVRIKLNKGFFQYMVRYHNSIDPFGNPSTPGAVISQSQFRFNSPRVQMQIASTFNGMFHEDSTVNDDFNRIDGMEFVMIYNEGAKILLIDGVKVDSKLVNISTPNIQNQVGIDFQFTLGHLAEFAPRHDELFIEELEVFTWEGQYPD